jgi:signal transduction histidine kinase
MQGVSNDFQADIEAINSIASVRTILDVICRVTGMGFAAVARVTPDRWVALSVRDDIAFGLKPGGELKVDTTICHEIRQCGEPVVIDHVSENDKWRDHHTPKQYGFQSYISMPIFLRDGQFFGTLCAIDPKPAKLENFETIGMFRAFADLIAFHLDASRRLQLSEESLLDERKTAELREQFIAVLGHDLRNPLAAVAAGIRLLHKEQQSEKSRSVLGMMQSSVARMTGLIGDVLDFARGRLGGGFAVEVAEENMQAVLAQVAGELSGANPEREIDMEMAVSRPVYCDRARIGQLFSNLLGNALAHGARDKPIRVRAGTAGGVFELSVSNAGEQIPPAAIPQLFKPFVRGTVTPSQQGLGLGLYIASEIARAHGGTLTATSSPQETCFTFRMKL